MWEDQGLHDEARTGNLPNTGMAEDNDKHLNCNVYCVVNKTAFLEHKN